MGVGVAVFAFLEEAGGVSSSSSSSRTGSAVFLALFLEAGVVLGVAEALLLGVLGAGELVLELLFWILEERAPYLCLCEQVARSLE